jgi:hypothetical protein
VRLTDYYYGSRERGPRLGWLSSVRLTDYYYGSRERSSRLGWLSSVRLTDYYGSRERSSRLGWLSSVRLTDYGSAKRGGSEIKPPKPLSVVPFLRNLPVTSFALKGKRNPKRKFSKRGETCLATLSLQSPVYSLQSTVSSLQSTVYSTDDSLQWRVPTLYSTLLYLQYERPRLAENLSVSTGSSGTVSLANGHTTLNLLVLVRSPKSRNVGPS